LTAPIEPTHDSAGAHESALLRRAARWGASGPEWWLRFGPPVFGWMAAGLLPSARHAVLKNLERVRGPASAVQNTRDVLATFGAFASCITEVLSNESPRGPRLPTALVLGERNVREALDARRGIVLVTAHTAGWDIVGPLLGKTYGLDLVLVTHAEPDAGAGEIQDAARRRAGVAIARVGDDPLSSLPLLRHLQRGGVVALQLDRAVPGMRTRKVPLLGTEGEVPEGPFRLAALSGAPMLPIFCARRGHREYLVEVFEAVRVPRRASEAELDRAAASVAASMTRFLRAHPTQWFQFGGG
jgi:KDO2-lipid IV(A) lauroyltransferase